MWSNFVVSLDHPTHPTCAPLVRMLTHHSVTDTCRTEPWGFLEDEDAGDATRVMQALPRTIPTESDTFREIVEKDRIVLLWITIDRAHTIQQIAHLDTQ